MNIRTTGIPALLAAVLALQACELVKSETPLSSSIAGPIAGVEITPPQPMQPASGAKIRTGGPPVTLVVQNASSNGVRPLSYRYEVARDAGFGDVVFMKNGVAPGGNGHTSLPLGDTLPSDTTYYWRSMAEDGANASSFSSARTFQVVDPPVLHAPVPLSPIDNFRVGSLSPTLRVSNAPRSGDVQAVRYDFEVSPSPSFGVTVASGTVDEENGSTEYRVEDGLNFDLTYFWRARAQEATVTGPWSNAGQFQTPVPTAPPGGGGGGSGGGGPINCSGAGSGVPSAAEGEALIACVKSQLQARGVNLSGSCGAFEITLRVAWLLRDRGARIELYDGTSCNGHSHDIILFMPSGVSVDMLTGAGGENGPAWQVHHELIPGAPHVFPWNPDGEP